MANSVSPSPFHSGRARFAAGFSLLLALLVTAPVAAQSPTGLGGAWKPQGPGPAFGGQSENASPNNAVVGAIHTVLAHPSDPNTLYIGSANGGVWKTTNATSASPQWKALTDTLPTSAIGALDFDYNDAQRRTLWAGVGLWSSFGFLGGNRVGLYRSTNAGNSWTNVTGGGILLGKDISGVAARGNTIVVAVDIADVFTFGNIGIWRSTNGGASFTQISRGNGSATGLPGGVTYDLVGDAAHPARLFTSVVFANAVGGANGVYRSTDTGATWTKVSNAAMDALLVSGSTDNVEFAVGNHDDVYAAIDRGGRLAGLFRSGDGGTTWTSMDIPLTGPNLVGIHPGAQGFVHLSIAADPTDADIVYLGGDRQPRRAEEGLPAPAGFPNSIGARNFSGRLFRCDAGLAPGSQCSPLTHVGTVSNSSPHADSRELTFDAAGNLIETDDGGVWRRSNPRDATGDWSSINGSLQVSEQHDVSYDTTSDIAFAGTQDNDDPHQSLPSNPQWFVLLSGDGGDTAVETQSLGPGFSTRYDSAQGLGNFVRTFWDAGNNLLGFVFPPLTPIGGSPPFVGQFVTPVELNAVTPTRLVLGGANGVYESLDQGDTVQRISTLLINGNGVDAVSYGGAGNAELLIVGSGDRLFMRTAAHPAPLTEVLTFPGRGSGLTVRDAVVDPANANAIYVNNRNNVYRTLDGGATWSTLTGDLQTFQPIALRGIAFIPRADDLNPALTNNALVISTFNGIYVAREESGFTNWRVLGSGLPNVPIFDLHYDATDQVLVAGTLGRGAWKLQIGAP